MDASVGLTFSLQLFQRYQRSGVLEARLRHVPGVQGPCTAYIHLTMGAVTACYLENKQGQHLPYAIDELCRIDRDRGPFEWIFQAPASTPPAQTSTPVEEKPTQVSMATPEIENLVPKVMASLRWEQFEHWTPEQKLLLQHVWKSIDGRRTVREMKASLPYQSQLVNDVLQILLTLRFIAFAS